MAPAACKNPQGDFRHASLSEGPIRCAGVVAALPRTKGVRGSWPPSLLNGVIQPGGTPLLRTWQGSFRVPRHLSAIGGNRPWQFPQQRLRRIGQPRQRSLDAKGTSWLELLSLDPTALSGDAVPL